VKYFKPRGVPLSEIEIIVITHEELESLRLVDLEGLHQVEAAQKMGISRKAFWQELQSARKKAVFALTTGKAIEIKGGNYVSSND